MTRLLRGVCVAIGAAVAGLHLRILWARLADGSVLDPVVAARWLTAFAIGLFFAFFHRRGISLVRGREALILWLLVALLHGVGFVPEVAATQVMPAEIFLAATPFLGVAALVWAGALALRRADEQRCALRSRRALRRGCALRLELDLLAAAGPRAPPPVSP